MNNFNKIQDSFCVLPFTHLATNPDGSVMTCCESKYFAPNLNLNNNSIEEIRSNPAFQEVKEFMLEGKKHESCNFCYKREEKGLPSKRLLENKKFNLTEERIEYFLSEPLISAELRLGNLCNAKCLICNPHSSSKWNEDAEAVGIKKVVLTKDWYKNKSIYKNIVDHSKDLKQLRFNGGEPTLMKEHFYLLEALVQNKLSTDIELEYHLNGTNLPDKLIRLWQNFKYINIVLSIDDIFDRLYYSRYPTEHSSVIKTVEKLKKNNIKFDIIPSISLYNIFNVDNIYNFFKSNYNIDIILNFVRYPKILSIANLPDSIKLDLINKFKKNKLPPNLIEQIQYNFYASTSLGISKFLEYTKKLDINRKLSILEYLPEWKIWTQKVI